MNLSFEYGYPHIFHEILYLSVHWLSAYRNASFAMLSISDANPCECANLHYVGARRIMTLRSREASNVLAMSALHQCQILTTVLREFMMH